MTGPPQSPSRAFFITHQGKRILLIDFSLINEASTAFTAIEEVRAIVAREPPGSLLTLTDVRGSSYTPKILEALKDLTVHNRPYVRAAAIVGVTGVLRLGLSMITTFAKREFKTFGDMDSAKKWLVSHEEK